MTSPVNSGWQVAPVMMNHEPDGWKAIPFATISSTSFSFEETVVRALQSLDLIELLFIKGLSLALTCFQPTLNQKTYNFSNLCV